MKQNNVNELNWYTYIRKNKFIKVGDNLYIHLRKTSTTYIIRKTVTQVTKHVVNKTPRPFTP
jgi:hypothetical protein